MLSDVPERLLWLCLAKQLGLDDKTDVTRFMESKFDVPLSNCDGLHAVIWGHSLNKRESHEKVFACAFREEWRQKNFQKNFWFFSEIDVSCLVITI